MTFPVALDDVASIIEDGSAERAEFEASFKTTMAASLGGGNAVAPAYILIDSITGDQL